MTLSPPVVRGYFYGYIFMALIQAKKDLTRGSMTGNLLTFAVPFLLANLFQALYAAVDLWVVGKFGGGKIGTAAVSNGGEGDTPDYSDTVFVDPDSNYSVSKFYRR